MGVAWNIGVLTVADLPQCLALAQDRGWPAEEGKWRLLFELGTVWGARDDSGDVVGTAIVTRYGTSLAVLSMVLVASRHGGQGLGRQLVTQALAATPTRTAALFATEAGRPLYEKFGFTAVEELHTYVGSVPGHATARSRPATPEDVSAIAALDAAIVGAPRGELVQRLLSFATRLHVVELDDHIVGYGAAWRNLGQLMIGPVVAADRRAAATLIGDLARDAGGSVRVDLLDHEGELRDWVESAGATLRSSTTLMVSGSSAFPEDRGRWFSPVMQALG